MEKDIDDNIDNYDDGFDEPKSISNIQGKRIL